MFDKYRLSVGIEYEIGKNQSIELFYIYKGEIKKSDIEVTNITGLKYEYSF